MRVYAFSLVLGRVAPEPFRSESVDILCNLYSSGENAYSIHSNLSGLGLVTMSKNINLKWSGGSFNITSSSGNLHSTLHCSALTQTKRLRKD